MTASPTPSATFNANCGCREDRSQLVTLAGRMARAKHDPSQSDIDRALRLKEKIKTCPGCAPAERSS